MDLRDSIETVACRGFPRPRGDGPLPRVLLAYHHPVSPPTRGWTSITPSPEVSASGFPAHAGMDRHCRSSLRGDRRFPRPRGDGPAQRRTRPRNVTVSPPTRGWTAKTESLRTGGVGFPAHAGMDPGRDRRPPTGTRFPRPRGDGPSVSDIRGRMTSVSPPTRGWTDVRERPVVAGAGFPAHAGMDPGPILT